jgi:uncharacterized membrane protein
MGFRTIFYCLMTLVVMQLIIRLISFYYVLSIWYNMDHIENTATKRRRRRRRGSINK